MTITAKVILDSVAPSGVRLTTFELTYPRFIHSELMTHRQFCLAGDSMLEFDLPSGTTNNRNHKRVHHMRLDEFVDKWVNGARRYGSKPKGDYDLSWADRNQDYPVPYAASKMGMASASNMHKACRDGELNAWKLGNTWMTSGDDLLEWRSATPFANRYDMKARLANMQIRQLNEKTGDIQTSRVLDALCSGRKEIFEVWAGGFKVSGSVDHKILTVDGWLPISEIKANQYILVRKFGKREYEKEDPLRLKKINGIWRSKWQTEQRERLISENRLCRRCMKYDGENIHHIIPVHENPNEAFSKDNITLLCSECHKKMHETQGWQGGTYLYGAVAKVESVISKGEAETFDLEIAGEFPNFLANGVVVHNSRNAASSRAIPTPKKIERIREDMAKPSEWGVNQKGMQSSGQLSPEQTKWADVVWTGACEDALVSAEMLCGIRCAVCKGTIYADGGCGTCITENQIKLELHKQVTNRILEPYDNITTVVTATSFTNHWKLRLETDKDGRPMADPTYFELATKWKACYDASVPYACGVGDWHLPYVYNDALISGDVVREMSPEDYDALYTASKCDKADFISLAKKVSVGRIARTSYMRQGQGDIAANIELHDRLAKAGHWSPFEPVATPIAGIKLGKADAYGSNCTFCSRDINYGEKFAKVELAGREPILCKKCSLGHVTSGNFLAWAQYRKEFRGESGDD